MVSPRKAPVAGVISRREGVISFFHTWQTFFTETLRLITSRLLKPAALSAFWISVFFLPGIIQTVVSNHESELRHEFRERLIQELKLFPKTGTHRPWKLFNGVSGSRHRQAGR